MTTIITTPRQVLEITMEYYINKVDKSLYKCRQLAYAKYSRQQAINSFDPSRNKAVVI